MWGRPASGCSALSRVYRGQLAVRWRFGRPVVASPGFSVQARQAVWGYANQVAGPKRPAGREPAGWRRACWVLGVASGGWPGGDLRPTLGLASQRPASRRLGPWRGHAGQAAWRRPGSAGHLAGNGGHSWRAQRASRHPDTLGLRLLLTPYIGAGGCPYHR